MQIGFQFWKLFFIIKTILFSQLKSDLHGKKFTSDGEVISAVLNYFKDKNSEYFF